jgi:hypothetical protein
MNYTFEPDPELQELAGKQSLAAVGIAKKNFGVELDFSRESVERVEQVLGRLHDLADQQQPDEERVWLFAQLFGSYVGEVIRREHGGGWGMIESEGQRFPGFMFGSAPTTIWPWSRVHKRLVDGAENNVWHYFVSVTDDAERQG